MGISWNDLSERLLAAAEEKGVAYSAEFELTPRCNLNCVMCYIKKPAGDEGALSRELPAAWWIDKAKAAADEGLLHALLTGGEPFLRPDFREIYEGLYKMGLLVTINTNGTLITQETANWLAESPPNMVSVTIYGGSEESSQRITGSNRAVLAALRGIDFLLEQGIKVEIKTTWVKGNKEDYQQILEFAHARQLRFSIVNYVSPAREQDCGDPLSHRLDPLELAQHEMDAEDYIYQRIDSAGYLELEGAGLFKSDDEPQAQYTPKSGNYPCTAGTTSFWMTWDGFMLPCGEAHEPRVDARDKSYAEAWEALKSVSLKVPSCKTCDDCADREACIVCPARLYNETGSFEEKAPYLCEHAKGRKISYQNGLEVIDVVG